MLIMKQMLSPVLFALLLFSAVATHSQGWIKATIDRDLITSKMDVFNMVDSGKQVVGSWKLGWKVENEVLTIYDTSVLYNVMEETLIQKTNLKTVRSISAEMDIASTSASLSCRLASENGVLNGNYILTRGDSTTNLPISSQIGEAEISRMEMFAYIHSLPLKVGLEKELKVFSITSNSVISMTLKVLDTQTVTVPMGSFEVYVVELKTPALTNMVYVQTKTPRIVKVGVVGRNLNMELVSTRPL